MREKSIEKCWKPLQSHLSTHIKNQRLAVLCLQSLLLWLRLIEHISLNQHAFAHSYNNDSGMVFADVAYHLQPPLYTIHIKFVVVYTQKYCWNRYYIYSMFSVVVRLNFLMCVQYFLFIAFYTILFKFERVKPDETTTKTSERHRFCLCNWVDRRNWHSKLCSVKLRFVDIKKLYEKIHFESTSFFHYSK